jgi:CDP-glucose 4,6-dehydratase
MFQDIYKNKKVIVTGHTGFKGGWMCLWLTMMGADVYGISNEVYSEPSLYDVAGIDAHITSYIADIRDLNKMKEIFSDVKPDFVFHMAAQAIVKKAYTDPLDTFATNVMGTGNILEALRINDIPCTAVMITSDKCYDNVEWIWGYKETDQIGGKDPYSASKGGSELIIKTYYHSYFKKDNKIKISAVRAGNVIGGGDWADARIVPDCFRAWAKDEKVLIRSPRATRPWQHVLEPISGYLRTGQLLASPEDKIIQGEPYNFGPPADQNHNVLSLIQELAKNWSDSESDMVQVEDSNFPESGLLKLNIDKALHDLDWKPALNFAQTAAFTSDWYKEYYTNKSTNMFEYTSEQIKQYIQSAKQNGIIWALK